MIIIEIREKNKIHNINVVYVSHEIQSTTSFFYRLVRNISYQSLERPTLKI